MSLPESDHDLITAELGREPTRAEANLFENLWSEHCAYRSSRPLLGAFDSAGDQVVIGPGDDAAVIAVPEPDAADTPASDRDPGDYSETYITLGIESHNHPSYVDPYDGAATGVGGIVRDTLSMGAYPIALADSLYFGDFDREHSQYLFEGVVEGIADYGNSIGVPTVAGSVDFHGDYEGNPLVNVACVGLTDEERMVTAEAQQAGTSSSSSGTRPAATGWAGPPSPARISTRTPKPRIARRCRSVTLTARSCSSRPARRWSTRTCSSRPATSVRPASAGRPPNSSPRAASARKSSWTASTSANQT
jgi:Phosphoribosylformylglycinamidine (FGAM) synthase, synthetase domain